MERLKKIPKIYWLLLFVAFTGIVGIFYNYGMIAGGLDESLKVGPTLKFFRDFHLRNEYSSYPPMALLLEVPLIALVFLGYWLLGIGDLSQLKELVIVDTYKLVPYFRFTTIIFGLVAVFVFYKICLLLFKKERPALIGAYLLTVSLLFVQQIHIAGTWVEQTMMILIALYYFLTLLNREKWHIGVFVISALLIVFSVEIEPVGLIAIVPFFLIYFQKRKETGMKNEPFNLFIFFLTFVLGILLFIYIDPVTFREYFSFANQVASVGFKETIYGQGLLGRFFGFFEISFLLEPFLLILFFFGLLAAYKKDRFLFKIFGSYILVYYLILGPLTGGFVERRILLAIPALAVFSAFFLEHLITQYQNRGIKKFLYAGLLILLLNPILFNFALLKGSSYIKARNWVYKNIEANAFIRDDCWLELNENQEVLTEIRNDYPQLLTARRKYLLDNPHILSFQKGYFVVRESDIVKNMDKGRFQYLVLCYSNENEKQKLLSHFNGMNKKIIYSSLADKKSFAAVDLFSLINFSDLKNFGIEKLLSASYHGPHFEIYQFL